VLLLAISPRNFRRLDTNRDYQRVIVRKGNGAFLYDALHVEFLLRSRELTCERVVDLKLNPYPWQVVLNIHIPPINKARNSRLWFPGGCLVEDCSFNSVETIPAIAKYIFNVSTLEELVLEFFLSCLDARKAVEVPLLSLVCIMDCKPQALRKALRRPEVMRPVAEGLEFLPAGVGFGDGSVTIEFLCNFSIRVVTLQKHSLHFPFVCFPNDNTEVGRIKVDVKKGLPGVWCEKGADIRQLKVAVFTFAPGRDVLKVKSTSKGVLA